MPGLAKGQLHEIHASRDDWASAMAFGLSMADADRAKPIVLLRALRRAAIRVQPYAEGWMEMGIDPARLVIVNAGDVPDLLRAGLDAARSSGLAAVLLETWGKVREYDLVASRRLVLAAERSRIPVIVLRGEAEPRASAAHSRWLIRSAASTPLSAAPSTPVSAHAPGPAAIAVELLRRRGGPAGMRWRLEWSVEHGCFREQAAGNADAQVSGAVVSLFAVRTGEPERRSA